MSMRQQYRLASGEISNALTDFGGFLRTGGLYLLLVILASGGMFIFQPTIAGDDWGAYTGDGGQANVTIIERL